MNEYNELKVVIKKELGLTKWKYKDRDEHLLLVFPALME